MQSAGLPEIEGRQVKETKNLLINHWGSRTCRGKVYNPMILKNRGGGGRYQLGPSAAGPGQSRSLGSLVMTTQSSVKLPSLLIGLQSAAYQQTSRALLAIVLVRADWSVEIVHEQGGHERLQRYHQQRERGDGKQHAEPHVNHIFDEGQTCTTSLRAEWANHCRSSDMRVVMLSLAETMR